MEDREEIFIMGDLAHVDYGTQRCQHMKEHAGNTAAFAKEVCQIPEMKGLAELVSLLHDPGKMGPENQEDFQNILKLGNEAHKHGLDHSTAGGRMILELAKDRQTAEFLNTVIYFHHGLGDCINLETGQSLQEARLKKEIAYEEIKERFFQIYDRKLLEEKCEKAGESYKILLKKIETFVKKHSVQKDGKVQKKCGNPYFFLGMYFRVLLSLLMDGDWTDTACFFQGIPLQKRMSKEKTQEIWNQCTEYFEQYLSEKVRNNPENGSRLNAFRQEISDSCKKAAGTDQMLYRLTVPTGAGKTLSSLRFALHLAKRLNKQHILYVAPFISILEQNAEEIRQAVGDTSVVLEHHCNVVVENGEEETYRSLTETWDQPIIVTTAVQMLNTLFSDQKSCIRRLHVLCDSILIFDEVQAIPVRCTELFHLAVNFLSQFCQTTVVLCSATQPTLAPLQENNICSCMEMSGAPEKYAEAFQRVHIVDETEQYPGGMEIEDLKEVLLEKAEKYGSVLAVVNTTACAYQTFRQLFQDHPEEMSIFHLSNNMCPQHKMDVLKKIREALKDRSRKTICVSTQLVEAGVNFSFGAVVRSMAGLDNVIQAAGRCNRHKEFEKMGEVSIVKMSEKAENLTHLKEIQNAQAALQKVLDGFRKDQKAFGNSLDSEQAVKAYYRYYYAQIRPGETKFPVKEYGTNLTDLLGRNLAGSEQYRRAHGEKAKTKLPQAFETAGQKFQVISNDHKVSVVVLYNEEARQLLEEAQQAYPQTGERKKIFRKLQRYTVGISETRKERLGNAIYASCDKEILVLCDGYYDQEAGVVEEPHMESCFL